MDEKKLREVYESIQIEDGVYRNLVASALRKQRERIGKRQRRTVMMRYALSAASVVLVLAGLVMFTSKMPFKQTVANATTLESETEPQMPVSEPTQETAEAEEDIDRNEEFWSVSDLRIVNEYSEQFDGLTEVQREAIFTAFEIMDAQEVYMRDMANLEYADEMTAYWNNVCGFFDEKILNVSYQVYPTDPEVAMNNMDERTRIRFQVIQNAIEDGVYNGSSFSQSMRYHMLMKYEAQLEDEVAGDSEAGLWGMLEVLNMDRAERAIAGLQDGTVVTIEKESGFFYVEYSVFEDDIMLVSSGYAVGNNVWGRLGDGEYIELTDENGLRNRRIYGEAQREMYVLEDAEVYQITLDAGKAFAEICQGDTVIELAQTEKLWSCIKVGDTIGYVKSEYLSEWIPVTVMADDEIPVSAEYEDWAEPTRRTEDLEEYEDQVPPTRLSEE